MFGYNLILRFTKCFLAGHQFSDSSGICHRLLAVSPMGCTELACFKLASPVAIAGLHWEDIVEVVFFIRKFLGWNADKHVITITHYTHACIAQSL